MVDPYGPRRDGRHQVVGDGLQFPVRGEGGDDELRSRDRRCHGVGHLATVLVNPPARQAVDHVEHDELMGIGVAGQVGCHVPAHAPEAQDRDPHAGTPGPPAA